MTVPAAGRVPLEAPWLVTVRNPARQEVETAAGYLRLRFAPRLNDVGDWSLRLRASHPAARLFASALAAGTLGDWGVVIRPAGAPGVPFSGLASAVYLVEGGDAGPRATVTVTGVSDEAVLTDLVYPTLSDVASGSSTTFLSASTVQSAVAETALLNLVRNNLGALAPARRRRPWLTIPASSGRGGAVVFTGRMDGLLDACREIAERGGIAFRVRHHPATAALRLEVYVPQVLPEARFAVGTTLDQVEAVGRAPTTDEVVVGGGGEGTARVFRRRGGTATGLSRRARFVDQRHTTDAAELDQAGDERLAEDGPTAGFRLTPSADSFLRFGVDYDLGDRVTVALADGTLTVTETVRQVVVVHDAEQGRPRSSVTTPTVGRLDDEESPQLLALVRRQARQIAQLATRR